MRNRLVHRTAAVCLASLLPFACYAKAKWTIMCYQASDNNLEAPQLRDLAEMAKAGGNSQVNIIVFCDRSEEYTNEGLLGLQNWTTAKIFKVTKNKLTQLSDWGETDTADGKTLDRFLSYATRAFPAEKYGLILEDHGGGWLGGFSDATSLKEGDELTVNEIKTAIKKNLKPNKKLEFVGFDACLMSNLETAHALSPVAKYLFASEEVEPGEGWHYTPWINMLKANPGMSTLTLGKKIVDSFFDSYDKSNILELKSNAPMITLAVTDLSLIDQAVQAVQRVADAATRELANNRSQWIHFAGARSLTESYAVEDGDSTLALYDAVTLFGTIKGRDVGGTTVSAARDAETKLKAAVRYARRGKARPQAMGLSICVPKDSEVIDEKAGNAYSLLPFNSSSQWRSFLGALSKETEADTTPPFIGTIGLTDSLITSDNTVSVTAEMKEAADIEQNWLFLARKNDADDNMLILGKMPAPATESELMAVQWDGKWFQITDGENFYICPTMNTVKNSGGLLFYVLGQVKAAGSPNWVNATLVFFLDKSSRGDATFVYALHQTEFGLSEVKVKEGDAVRPLFAEVLNDGEPRLVFMEGGPNLFRNKNFRVTYGDVTDGEYLIGFIAEDYSGNISSSFTSCRIKRQ